MKPELLGDPSSGRSSRPRVAPPALFPSFMPRAGLMDTFLTGRADSPGLRLFKPCLESQEESWRPFLGEWGGGVTAVHVPADSGHFPSILHIVSIVGDQRFSLKKKIESGV